MKRYTLFLLIVAGSAASAIAAIAPDQRTAFDIDRLRSNYLKFEFGRRYPLKVSSVRKKTECLGPRQGKCDLTQQDVFGHSFSSTL